MASEPVPPGTTATGPSQNRYAQNLPASDALISSFVFSVLLVDPDGCVAHANPAAESLLGTSLKRIIGLPIGKVITALDTRVSAKLSSGDGALVARDVRVSIGGREMPVNLTVSALPSDQGWRAVTLSPLVHEKSSGVQQDVAPRGAPSILAHEIKNPLAAIRGAAQLIARKLPHGDKKLARMITDEVDRIARLIDRMQLLGSTQPQDGEPCNLHEAIRSAIATVRTGGMEGVEVAEEFDPSLPMVLAHRDALEQVLINLISNARDAAASAHANLGVGARVIIRTRYVSGMQFSAIRLGRSVKLPIEITISDNGGGIDPSLRDRIFEPFVSSKASGQGLGLALVRKLMRDMNGNVSHEREIRSGLTHFRLHLPVATSDAVEAK